MIDNLDPSFNAHELLVFDRKKRRSTDPPLLFVVVCGCQIRIFGFDDPNPRSSCGGAND
jgi:hypothetical protein